MQVHYLVNGQTVVPVQIVQNGESAVSRGGALSAASHTPAFATGTTNNQEDCIGKYILDCLLQNFRLMQVLFLVDASSTYKACLPPDYSEALQNNTPH